MTVLPTLNLLPANRKHALRNNRIAVALFAATSLLGITLLVGAGLLITDRFILQENLTQLQDDTQRSEQAIIQQQGSLPQDRIRQYNTLIARIAKIQTSSIEWTPYLADLEARLPAGITAVKIELSDNKQLQFAGIAATREELQNVKQALSSSSLFRNVTSPSANLLDRTNVSFTFTAEVVVP